MKIPPRMWPVTHRDVCASGQPRNCTGKRASDPVQERGRSSLKPSGERNGSICQMPRELGGRHQQAGNHKWEVLREGVVGDAVTVSTGLGPLCVQQPLPSCLGHSPLTPTALSGGRPALQGLESPAHRCKLQSGSESLWPCSPHHHASP